MKIVFMGTPDFSVGCLNALIASGHEISGVFCQPDKPKGRAQTLTPPPVKQAALEAGLKIYQPQSLKNGKGTELLKALEPDIVVVVAYGKILPKDFLEYPKYGCVNIHASLLPKYRGAAPIQWSIINVDEETGVTSMQMDEGLDTGDMLLCEKIKIGENETAGELFDRLSDLGAEVLIKTLEKIESGNIVPIKQNNEEATYVGMLSKDLSPVDWSLSATQVHNKIRGLYPWPCATAVLDGKIIKLHSSVICDESFSGSAGEVVCSDGRLIVCCGDGKCIEIQELQSEGKKRMTSAAFLNGRKVPLGTILK